MDRGAGPGTDPSEEEGRRREGPPHSPTQPSWRLLRKRYAVRVEFEQSGSLGEEEGRKEGGRGRRERERERERERDYFNIHGET